jgi:hypothetical protein
VTSAEETMVVPSIRPRTISAVRARRRVTLRMPSLKKMRFLRASAPTAPTRAARATMTHSARGPIGMPKSSFITAS